MCDETSGDNRKSRRIEIPITAKEYFEIVEWESKTRFYIQEESCDDQTDNQ